jgi:hypothetical protein
MEKAGSSSRRPFSLPAVSLGWGVLPETAVYDRRFALPNGLN